MDAVWRQARNMSFLLGECTLAVLDPNKKRCLTTHHAKPRPLPPPRWRRGGKHGTEAYPVNTIAGRLPHVSNIQRRPHHHADLSSLGGIPVLRGPAGSTGQHHASVSGRQRGQPVLH